MSDDEPIPSAVLDIATAAQHLLTVAESLAAIHGEEVVRSALAVALVTFSERTVGRAALLEELRREVELTANPTIADAVMKWLH